MYVKELFIPGLVDMVMFTLPLTCPLNYLQQITIVSGLCFPLVGASSLKLLYPHCQSAVPLSVSTHSTWFTVMMDIPPRLPLALHVLAKVIFSLLHSPYHMIPQIFCCSNLYLTFLTVCPLSFSPTTQNTLLPDFLIPHPPNTQFFS